MKQSVLKCALFVVLPVFWSVPQSLHGSTIFFEDFTTATVGLDVTTAGAFSTVNGTNVDVLGGANFGGLCSGPESGNCVDMGGSGGNPLGQLELTTPLNLAAGVYDLSFDLIGSQRGQTSSTTVKFGSYSQTFILTSGDLSSGVVVNLPVTIAGGMTQLEFINNGDGGSGNIGAVLDDVSITNSGTPSNPSPVPEPGTVGLLATGLLGIVDAVRRRLAG